MEVVVRALTTRPELTKRILALADDSSARVRFQACDDTRCMAPEQVEMTFAVEIA